MKKYGMFMLLMSLSAFAIAADGNGKISNIFFASKNFVGHPDIVQFKIEGGYSKSGCDSTFAAVRTVDSHLISALLAAKMADKAVEVYLDQNDIYYNVASNYPNRCIAIAIVIP